MPSCFQCIEDWFSYFQYAVALNVPLISVGALGSVGNILKNEKLTMGTLSEMI